VAEVKDGRVERFAVGDYAPIMVFDRPAASKSGTWLLPTAIVALVALFSTVLAWPISALTRRYYRAPGALSPADAKAQRTMRIVATATVVAWAGWIALIVAMISNFSLLAPRTDALLISVQVFGLIVFVVGTVVGLWAASGTVRGARGKLAKAWAVVLGFALLVSLWVAFAFHLLSIGAKY
jgi:hypothetical protein